MFALRQMKCNPRSGSFGGAGVQRVLGQQLGPVFAAAPQNAMKANGGHQIVAEAFWTETEHGDEFCESGRASGVIGVARIRAMHMRAERAARRPSDL
mgnify:CR=1 FL=1